MFFEQIKLADRLRNRPQVARGIINLGVQLLAIGAQELGATLVEKGIVVARECHDPAQLAHGLLNLASTLSQSDTVRTSAIIDEAVEVARRSGSVMNVDNAVANQAINRWATGDWDLVLATDVESLAPFMAPVAATIKARVLTARSALDRAYAFSQVYDDFTLFYGVALEIALTAGDADLLDHLRRVVDEDGSSLPTGLQGHRALLGALDAERVGDTADVAEASFSEALARYADWGSPVHEARAQAAYGVWLTTRGRIAEAEPLLTAARAAYASLGAVAWLAELEEALSGHRVGS
jgi:hypothetical protein